MISDLTAARFPLLTPFQQPVTYYSRAYAAGIATDTYTAYALPQARTRELGKNDFALNPELLGTVTLVFELWKPVLDAAGMGQPKKDDYLVDACGRGWTVHAVEGRFHSNNFLLTCIKRV